MTKARKIKKKPKGKGHRKGSTSSTHPRSAPLSTRGQRTVLTLLTVFVLLLGGMGVGMKRADHLQEPEKAPTAREEVLDRVGREIETTVLMVSSEIFSSTISDPSELEASLLDNLTTDLRDRYGPLHVDDYSVSVGEPSVDIGIKPMSVMASSCPGGTEVAGAPGPMTLPTYYTVMALVNLTITDRTGRTDPTIHSLEVEHLVPDLTPYLDIRMDELQANGRSEFTDIGRMVRYMLTTLVRFRADMGYGSGPYDTEKDLLNEGDVELAVNLAVLLEQARLFGTYDGASVRAIDHYFYHATDPLEHMGEPGWDPYNPTTLRPWGTAEKKNYARYKNRAPTGEIRTLENLFDEYMERGTLDPADLLALYLNLDQYSRGLDPDPLDGTSILHEEGLFDGRHPSDRRDPTHLEHLVDVGARELAFRDPRGDTGTIYHERPRVDQYPDYLVVGDDLKVDQDIVRPTKWMTNAEVSSGSRTGGVPPPQPPPEHDWVMQWDFDIRGSFDLAASGSRSSYPTGHGLEVWTVNRTMELDIPISIFTPLRLRPMNSAVDFTNLNVGSPPGATYNFTQESLLYEHFSNYTWYEVKDLFRVLMGDAIRLVKASTCPYSSPVAGGSPLTHLEAQDALAGIGIETWEEMSSFVEGRITTVDISTGTLRPLLNMEYFVELDLAPSSGEVRDTLFMEIRTNVGPISLRWHLAETGSSGGWAEVDYALEVPDLMEVMYSVEWDDGWNQPGSSADGILDGPMTLQTVDREGLSIEALEVDLVPGLTMAVVNGRLDGKAGPAEILADTLPDTVSGDLQSSTAFVDAWATALADEELPAMTLLLPNGQEDRWTGIEASDEDGVGLLLDWIVRAVPELVALDDQGLLEHGALGASLTGAVTDDRPGDLSVISLGNDSLSRSPTGYYSLMFQGAPSSGSSDPLELLISHDMTTSSDPLAPADASIMVLEFTPVQRIQIVPGGAGDG